MIKLFITDLDGCLSTPFKSPDWDLLSEIRNLNQRSKNVAHVPPLSICSGRPMPYVEAVAQLLNLKLPVIFENAGRYDPSSNQITTSPVFDDEADRMVTELKSWINREIISNHEGMIMEFTKKMDAGLIHPDKEVIDQVYPQIKSYVEDHYERFEVHHTEISINIILKENNKRNGIRMLCDELGIKPSEVAYIGDSSGDVPGLQLVGHPFAPQNAVDEVKEVATVVDASTTRAVLDTYKKLLIRNLHN